MSAQTFAKPASIPQISTLTRTAAGLALSALSGLMLTAAFAPYNYWPFIFVAFVPLIIAQFRVMPQKWSSLASAVMIFTWLYLYFGPTFFPGGFMLALPVIGFVMNLVFEKSLRTFHKHTGYRWFILYGAANWVGFEILRTFIPGIGTWGFVNYTLYSQTWLIQPVAVFGIYGLSLLIMFINFGLGQAAMLKFDEYWWLDADTARMSSASTRRWLLGIGIAAAAWTIMSLVMYSGAPDNPETVRVAAVQPGTTVVAFHDPDMDRQERFDILASLTREAAAQGAQIIVWPELVLPFDPQVEMTAELKALAAETNAYLVLPYGVIEEEGIRNESVTLTPDGEFLAPYAKAHPVLFAGEPYGLNVGTYPVHDTELATLATIICYDLNYTDVSRRMAANGAQIIAAPSNDWPGIAEKQNLHLVFRAIETRASFVKAESAYDSAIVDPYGHIIAESVSTTPTQTILVSNVPVGSADAPYLAMGDWLGWTALAGMAFFTIFSGRLEKMALKEN